MVMPEQGWSVRLSRGCRPSSIQEPLRLRQRDCRLAETPAAIQPHGFLLVVREPDLRIFQASDNAQAWLDVGQPVLGRLLQDVEAPLAAFVRAHLPVQESPLPRLLRCPVGPAGRQCDVQLHHVRSAGLVIECEPALDAADFSSFVPHALQRLVSAQSLTALCEDAVRLFDEVAGYDRIMVYRFDEGGFAEVVAEAKAPGFASCLGRRYRDSVTLAAAPSTREWYRIRALVDADAPSIPVRPRISPLTGMALDLSHCILQCDCPTRLDDLRRLGMRAMLTAHLVVGGRLWGQVICHHRTPRQLPYEARAVCELLAETMAMRIAAFDVPLQATAEVTARRLETRMVESIARRGEWIPGLFEEPGDLLEALGAQGLALVYEGRICEAGEVPDPGRLRQVAAWLDEQPRLPVIAVSAAGSAAVGSALESALPPGGGLLAVALSGCLGDYLIWFRSARCAALSSGWGAAAVADRVSVSRAFPVRENAGVPWTQAERMHARRIGESVADVVQQFRAVRVLIAQAQLAQARSQVRVSEQPMLMTDSEGRTVLCTQSLEDALGWCGDSAICLDDVLAAIEGGCEIARHIRNLVQHQEPWRGEVVLQSGHGERRPYLIRADPVFSAPERVLGVVWLFTDLAGRQSVDLACQRLESGIRERQMYRPRDSGCSYDPDGDRRYQESLFSVMANARLAAMEAAAGAEPGQAPAIVDGVRASLQRSVDLLEYLILEAAQTAQPNPSSKH